MDNINAIKNLLESKGNNSFVFHGKAIEEIWGAPCIAGTMDSHEALVEAVYTMPDAFDGYVLSDGQLSAVGRSEGQDVGLGGLTCATYWQNVKV